jgi:hypothetical protein
MSRWKRRSWKLRIIWRSSNGRLMLLFLLRMVIIGNPLENRQS